MILMQTKIGEQETTEQLDWDQLYVNFVKGIVFYKNEVHDIDTFRKKYKEELKL